MKKLLTLLTAVIAAFCLSSCNNEKLEEVQPSGDLKLNIKVADIAGVATKAVKTGWTAGDKINIWFDENTEQYPDLVIVYDGTEWDKDASATLSGNLPSESGYIKYFYEGFNDLSKYTYTTDIEDWDDYIYIDSYYKVEKANLLYSNKYDVETDYVFSSGILTASLESWKPVTEFQVVISGIDPEKYELKSDKLEVLFRVEVGEQYIIPGIIGGIEYTSGVENEDGAAFYFLSPPSSFEDEDLSFVLRNKETDEEYTYTAKGKTHHRGTFTAVKIPFDKFFAVPEAVDLGLSVKWASFNVGATKPEDYGYYFAWGETSEKTNYGWSKAGDYKWGIYDSSAYPKYGMTKYTADVEGGDGLKTLQPDDDPATVNWGSKWRTPTIDEIKELLDETKCEWTRDAAKKGYTVKGLKTGNSIFLPASGYRIGLGLADAGARGYYWSSSVHESYSNRAYDIDFYSGGHDWNYCGRYFGQPVRAVTE